MAAFTATKGCNMGAYLVDILAAGFFILEWMVYAVTLEHTAYGRDSLSARMHVYREVWIRRLLDREARMVDMQIMAALQNGTAFFASTSLLAVEQAPDPDLAVDMHAGGQAVASIGGMLERDGVHHPFENEKADGQNIDQIC